jgi:hypothetical protein
MRIEAFTEGKYLDDPDANEDRLVILPGRAYAVIDGVTDISGRIVDGMRTGRYASRVVQRAVAEAACDAALAGGPARALVERVTAALFAEYVALGIVDEVRAEPPRRFGATLTLALDLGSMFRFILVGDSGLRLNGSETIVDGAGLDRVTAVLRQEAYRLVAERGGGIEDQRHVSRLCSFYGTAGMHPEMAPVLDAAALATLHARSLAHAQRLFPAVPVADILHLVDYGIDGQTRFQNNTASPFSYSVFDGFDVPMPLVQVLERPRAALETIELYTDGYFRTGRTPELAAWEEAFAEVERLDPEKIGEYPSVKGSSARMRTDDRTLFIVRL